jgi:hypothetical protein
MSATAPNVGSSRIRQALGRLSKRNPIERTVSAWARCEQTMNASANRTGIATRIFRPPPNANTIHSTIKQDEITVAASQSANSGAMVPPVDVSEG